MWSTIPGLRGRVGQLSKDKISLEVKYKSSFFSNGSQLTLVFLATGVARAALVGE